MAPPELALLQQHLIDPEICIRCNTCESMCPVGAITHDARNYVVNAETCNHCMDCIAPCPTGAIDHWRQVPPEQAYSVQAQFSWDALPAALDVSLLAEQATATIAATTATTTTTTAVTATANESAAPNISPPPTHSRWSATCPPWSAAHAYTQLYGPKGKEKTVTAKVSGNARVTEVAADAGADYDTHHIVLDLGSMPFPVLEGQSIGIIPPGLDAQGRPHHARQYSVASPRNGERAGYNNLSLTVKRVLRDHSGHSVRGVASNYLCDLQIGDSVQLIGPFGHSFLMPNHAQSHLVMICTGTGSAPMRAMTEWRRRQRSIGKPEGGKLLLFFGARTQQELPYFGPLQNLPKDFIDINFAYSRTPGQPKRYVQDVMRERSADLALLLADPNSHFYVCGLQSMETGVLAALQEIAQNAGLHWETLATTLQREGRLHLETY